MVLNIISIIIAFAGLIISLIFSLLSNKNKRKNDQQNAEMQSKIQNQKTEWENYKKQQDKAMERLENERNQILKNGFYQLSSKMETINKASDYLNKETAGLNDDLVKNQSLLIKFNLNLKNTFATLTPTENQNQEKEKINGG